ncbi:MAG: GAF domain-containing sensor histidine kinase [Lacisediminihabitans sp.]
MAVNSRQAQERMKGLLDSFVAVAEDLSLSTVLERSVAAARHAVGARFGALGVIGAEGGLSHFITVGFDEETVARIGSYPKGHGVLGLLIRQPQAIRLHDLKLHPDSYGFPPGHPQMKSFLGVPIRVRGTVFGNLYLTEKIGSEDFTLEDEELAIAVASAAGVAVENSRLYEEAGERQRWLEASMDVERHILQHADGSQVLDFVAERARQVAQATTAVILLPSSSRSAAELRVVASAGGLPPESWNAEIRAAHADVATVLADDLPVVTQLAETPGYEWLTTVGARSAFGSGLLVPFPIPDRGRGIFLLARSAGAPGFTPHSGSLVAAFTGQVSRSLELAGAQALRERLAIFEERDRIALDLHDLVIQRLFAAGLTVQGLRRHLQEPSGLERVDTITHEIDETIRELRRTIYSLGQLPQNRGGLRAAALHAAASAASILDFEPLVHFLGPVDTAVDDATAAQILAAMTEGLSNASRHSGARAIEVEIASSSREVVLTIVDDGKGMGESTRRSGLNNLRQRAEERGGSLQLEANEPSGVRLVWRVPLGERPTDRG